MERYESLNILIQPEGKFVEILPGGAQIQKETGHKIHKFKYFVNNITDTINGVVKLITPSQKSFEYDISNLNDIWAVNNSRILLSNFMDYLLNKRCIKRLWINASDWITNFMNDNNVIAFCTEEKSIVYMKRDKNGAEIGGKIHINDLS